MGGVLVCRSEEGKGSEFIFTLSQKIIDSKPIGIFTENEDLIQKGPYTPQFIAPDADVIVASENLVNLNVLDSLLKPTKVFVTRANTKQDFLDKIRDNAFNVAFVDQLLFEDDEEQIEEFVAGIKEIDSKLPVYVFTENAAASEDYYKHKGFKGTLSLPVDSSVLERTIMRHLPREMMEIPDSHQLIEDLQEIPEKLKWLYDVEGLSVAEGIKFSGGIGNFLFGLKLFLDTIDDISGKIDEAYKRGDYNIYRVRNNLIRTSARIIGAVSLFDFTSKMEDAFKKDDKLFISANTDKLLKECQDFKKRLEKMNNEEDGQNV
jgi:CheY-like chemotaxis protein